MAGEKLQQTNVRLSKDGRRLIERLAARLGISFTDVIELAVRELAETKGMWPDEGPKAGRRTEDKK